jgi:multidrug efflux pump subunit AcrA (membrane-fusion protein)
MSEIPEIHDIANEHTVPAMEAVPSYAGPDISEVHTAAMAAMPPDSGMGGMPMDFGPLIDDTEDFDLTPMPPMPRRRRRLRWTAWAAIGLLVVLIGAGILIFLRSSHGTPVQYTQAAATTGNLTVTVAGSGPVAPNATYNLNFSASAPITAIYVKVGERVTKGQKLAALDPTTLQDAINQAQNTVNNDETSLTQAQTNLSTVKTQQSTSLSIALLNEQKALAACVPGSTTGSTSTNTNTALAAFTTLAPAATTPTVTSTATTAPAPTVAPTATPNAAATSTAESNCEQIARQQYTQSQQQSAATISNAENSVTAAQQKLSSDQTALATAKDNLKNDVLLAPHDGLIEAVNGLVGETASGGNSSGSSSSSSSSSSFIVLIDDSSLSIQAAVSEADIATIKVDQPATFTVAAYPSQTFRASVSSINTLGASSSSVVTYSVDLAVDMQSLNGSNIYSGMTATTSITTAERISTLLLPSTALSFSTTALQNGEITRSQLSSLASSGGTTGTTGSRGIVIELKAGKLVPVLVTTGLTNGQQTEILSGLQEGDEVVVGQTGGASATPSTSGGSGGNFRGGNFSGGGGGGNTIVVPKGGN